ncbi:hypothetical protein BJX66DRAFT_116681 [Aspergillus keveii]|uniref:Uncharacterized protein n=1 Tax=Aspergillus keveii TaxID=714993 RepID=A0ABR4FKC4_9EURO
MEDSVWGFGPAIEFDSGNLNDQMEANSLKKRQSALASSKYPAKSAQSPPLPVRCVSPANHPQEPKTWATRSTDHSGTANGLKEDEYWGFDPVAIFNKSKHRERYYGRELVRLDKWTPLMAVVWEANRMRKSQLTINLSRLLHKVACAQEWRKWK